MNPLGIQGRILTSHWRERAAAEAIQGAAACGYELIEIPVRQPELIDARTVRQQVERAGLKAIASLELGFASDISSGDPETVARGERLLLDALARAREVGVGLVTGVLYSALGRYREPPSEAGRWNCVGVLARLARRAKDDGITLGLEVVNRYESNLLNTARQALSLIDDIGADNVVLHLDSYHMNIEEGDPFDVIEACGHRLGYMHLAESQRGYLGTGTIDFPRLFAALARHGYRGALTFEAFSAAWGDPAQAAERAVWRRGWDDPLALARHARCFMAAHLTAAEHRRA